MSLDRRFCVAPMMRYTDMHERFFLRLISKKAVLYTEMISTGALIHGNCDYQLDFNKEEHPVAVQFGGSSPQELSQCSVKAEKKGYDEINLNIGCPSERVQKGNFGVCLMLEPDLVAECARQMRKSVDIPVTIKCRTGVDDNDDYEFLKTFINTVKDSGVKTFIVHARKGLLKGLSPRQNRNIPPLNYQKVYSLKEPLKKICSYPSYMFFVDYNGDVLMCSHDWGKKNILGNLKKDKIMDVWVSDNAMKSRKNLANGDREFSPCNVCDTGGSLIGEKHVEAWKKI